MTSHDYYDDRRYCPQCRDYVRYLSSPERTYCVECGGVARLFSGEDQLRFRKSVKHGNGPLRLDDDGYRSPLEA